MTTMLEITCRDPIVSRDGRPFGANQGTRMRSLAWLLPSVLAGSLRTTLGKSAERDFSTETARELLQVEVAGPFPHAEGQLYFPAPDDCVVHPKRGALQAAPQAADKGGCDWPGDGLRPVRVQGPDDFKPEPAPAWWPRDHYVTWLMGGHVVFDERFLRTAEIEDRAHVRVDPGTGSAEDGLLFTTAALALTHLPRYGSRNGAGHRTFAEISLSARIRAGTWAREAATRLDTLHPLGGERRLVHWKTATETGAWYCPEKIRDALNAARRVRMALTTPAIFSGGWKPGWLNDDLVGAPPGVSITMRLVGVNIQRWKAVSGWSLAELPGQPRGPKPVKRMVPAGGVYFFEILEGDASNLAGRWLEPVSDGTQDRRDGFGLAAWGIW
jgi:CRISPR-associated protein Cmr3